jgi:hypothetical protein
VCNLSEDQRITYVLQKLMLRVLPAVPGLYQHPNMPIPQGVHEIREHGYTFALLVAAIMYFSRERAARKSSDLQADRNSLSAASVGLESKGEKI